MTNSPKARRSLVFMAVGWSQKCTRDFYIINAFFLKPDTHSFKINTFDIYCTLYKLVIGLYNFSSDLSV